MKKKTIVSVDFSRKNEISALTRERSRLVFGVVSAFVRFEPLQTGRRFFLLVLSALVVAPYRALAKRLAKRHGQYKTGEYKKTIQNMQFNSGKVVRVNSSITTSINKRLQGYSYFRRVSGLAF